MPAGRGLVLYGPPAAGLDTVTEALSVLDPRFTLYQRLKVGDGRTAGYRIIDLDEFARADDAGELLHAYSRYGALYGIDRSLLSTMLQDDLVPVVHLVRVDGVLALLEAGFPAKWTIVCLWCALKETEQRLTARSDPRAEERTAAWAETLADLHDVGLDLFDLTINTGTVEPEQAAALIAQTVALDLPPDPAKNQVARRARKLFGQPRFVGYLKASGNSTLAAVELYEWNAAISAACWEVLGHVEVAIRNAMVSKLAERHRRRTLPGSWLDDPMSDLTDKAHGDIAKARRQVRMKGKPLSDGQVIAELGFGFWRFLLAHRYMTTIWPDLSYAFPYAPDRQLVSLEQPVARLWEIRNRIAHNERIWNQPIRELHDDALLVLGYIDPYLAQWVADRSRVPALLSRCPIQLPRP